MSFSSIPRRLTEQAKKRSDAPAYYVREGGRWKATSWRDYEVEVRQAANALLALGLPVGGSVCILGFNRPEWTAMALACMAAGGAPAGIYTTCSPEEVRYIIHHAEAAVVLVENVDQWKKIEKERARLPLLRTVVTMKGSPPIDDPMVLTWEQFLAKGKEVVAGRLDERTAALEPDGLATLIYTSGTTGPPKGVMLSHRNISWTADTARELVGTLPDDCVLSYLPLSHIAEQMFTIHASVTNGYAVYYAESIEKVADNLKEVQPTVFFGVPRIWEKFHAGISGKLADAKGVKRVLVDFAMGVGREVSALRCSGRSPTGLLALKYKVANRLIFSKLKPAIGLGRARVCVSGAAPIAKEVLEFFATLDIVVLEVYGQSEDTGPTSINLPGRARFGTVGPIIPGVEVKVADDGEILVRGPNVFLGYYKEPQATAETLIDGWLHSGDLGSIDKDGFLSITGRKKEIIITAGGKNITPKNIEGAIKSNPLVSEAVVIGDRRKYLTALVTLDPDAAVKFARECGKSDARPHEIEDIVRDIQKTIDTVNTQFARVEQVKKFKILSRAFTMDDGELTPTLKLKRKVIHDHFADEIESMYRE